MWKLSIPGKQPQRRVLQPRSNPGALRKGGPQYPIFHAEAYPMTPSNGVELSGMNLGGVKELKL